MKKERMNTMNEPQILEFDNQRILTTEQLAELYGATETQIKTNFNRNKNKFIEGVHFYLLQGDELKEFKNCVTNCNLVGKRATQLYLWTKRGASRHSKMLGTDRAWDMFDSLEENYFNPQHKNLVLASPREQLKLMFSFQEETAERVDKIEDELEDLKENQPISTGDYNFITSRIHQRVREVAKSYDIKNQKQRAELYKDINGGVKKITGVGARSQLRTKHYDQVIEYINDWEPSTATKSIVRQLELELV